MALESQASQSVSGTVKVDAAAAPKTDILNLDKAQAGKAVENAHTNPDYSVAALKVVNEIKQDSLVMANSTRPQTGISVGNSAGDAAATRTNQIADAKYNTESRNFAQSAARLTAEINGSNPDINATLEHRRSEVDAFKREASSTAYQAPATPPASQNRLDRPTDASNILGAEAPRPGGPGVVAPPAATGGSAAPGLVAAPAAAPADAPSAVAPAVAGEAPRVLAPVQATVSNLTKSIAASPIAIAATPSVANRPTGRFTYIVTPNTVIEPAFADVSRPSGATVLAAPQAGVNKVGASAPALGITDQTASMTVMPAMDLGKQAEMADAAMAASNTRRMAAKAPLPSYGKTVATA